jgi:hypothetical protein
MPVQFKISVTKVILEQSKHCGSNDNLDAIGKNCAIATALKDIFPDVQVSGHHIYPFGINEYEDTGDKKIPLPQIAQHFIKVFDSLAAIPNVRTRLPEFEFEISIPDEVISMINIDEALTNAKKCNELAF